MARPPVYTATGIILKRRNSGETDKVVTVFSREYGKLRLLAKGVRKVSSRRAGFLEPFRQVRVSVHSGRHSEVISEITSSDRPADEGAILPLGYKYFYCELVDRLTPDEEKHEEIFQMLSETLDRTVPGLSPAEYGETADNFANLLLERLGYLAPGKRLEHGSLLAYIEQIIERRLKSPNIIRKMIS